MIVDDARSRLMPDREISRELDYSCTRIKIVPKIRDYVTGEANATLACA